MCLLHKYIFMASQVDHFFRHRINSSVILASDYLKQFPSPIISIIAKFISFVSGGFAAILIIIAFLEESLLEGHVMCFLIHTTFSCLYHQLSQLFKCLFVLKWTLQIFGRNLFWYAAVFGTITAISRAAVADELLVLDPEGAMSMVVQHTHYMPKSWRSRENTEGVRREFETLFQVNFCSFPFPELPTIVDVWLVVVLIYIWVPFSCGKRWFLFVLFLIKLVPFENLATCNCLPKRHYVSEASFAFEFLL